MISSPTNVRVIAVCLSALAGYVDAMGFLHLGGFFVSFMSGNSTRLSVGLARGLPEAAFAAALIGLFLAGVILGTVVVHVAGGRPRQTVVTAIAVLLAAGALLHGLGADRAAIAAVVLAMGAENTIFQRDGEVSIGLTYMTGTLVKLGQRLAGTLLGGSRYGWAPYLMLWLGLVAGAALGATLYASIGLQGLWIAAAGAAAIAVSIGRGGIPSSAGQ